MKRLLTAATGLLLSSITVTGSAEQAAGSSAIPAAPESECSVLPDGQKNKVVICPPGLDMNAFRQAGMAACHFTAGCTAYIWDDADKAPAKSPGPGEKISTEHAAHLSAIWLNDAKEMMLVKRTR